MDLHSMKNVAGARHSKKRRGRGEASGLGKTSGRGHKGQFARSGATHREAFEGGQMPLIRRIPKRGFNHVNKNKYAEINVTALDAFDDGATLSFAEFRGAGLASGVVNGVKILGNGTVTKKFTVIAQAFSAGAKQKIEEAGGSCQVVERIK
ncbi:MAG: 50S ribosomal protein L15 [Spartobacteria bacterium]|nr:50S ribosomal protein L15 [Spartobacteria bacterium]